VNVLSVKNRDELSVLVNAVAKFKVEHDIFDYDLIVSKHRAWLTNLRDYLDGKNTNLKANAGDHKNCALGKWIYGEGTMFQNESDYRQLEQIHEQFHEQAAKIIALKDAVDRAASEAEYKQIMNMYHTIVDLLGKLKTADPATAREGGR
jgi:hypothetical protein